MRCVLSVVERWLGVTLAGLLLWTPAALADGGSFTEYTLPTSNGQPFEITPGPDGALWFTESNANKIGRITTGGSITQFPIPTAAQDPEGIVPGPDGNLWFTERRTQQG